MKKNKEVAVWLSHYNEDYEWIDFCSDVRIIERPTQISENKDA